MTKIIKKKLYCKKCGKYYQVPMVLSINSYILNRDENLKNKLEAGTLFKNYCPVCNEELRDNNE